MIKQTFIFLLVFFSTLYMYFIFDEDTVGYLLLFELSYGVVALIFCMIEKKHIKVTLKDFSFSVEREQAVPVQIVIDNQSKFFQQNIKLFFKLENTITGEKKKFYIDKTIPRASKKTITVSVSALNCGIMVISLKKIRVYDLFNQIYLGKKVKQQTKVTILPKAHLLPLEVTKKTRDFIADAEEYSDRESGDDVSEIFQVREYTEEDSARDIYWKMSAKMDELYVKEYGKTLGSTVLIWVNTDKKKIKKKKTVSLQALELLASISLSLYEQKCIHTVAWYEPERLSVYKKKISKEKNVYELMNLSSMVRPYNGDSLEAIYKDAFRGEYFSTIIEISLDGELLINNERYELPIQKGKIDWKRLTFSV